VLYCICMKREPRYLKPWQIRLGAFYSIKTAISSRKVKQYVASCTSIEESEDFMDYPMYHFHFTFRLCNSDEEISITGDPGGFNYVRLRYVL